MTVTPSSGTLKWVLSGVSVTPLGSMATWCAPPANHARMPSYACARAVFCAADQFGYAILSASVGGTYALAASAGLYCHLMALAIAGCCISHPGNSLAIW